MEQIISNRDSNLLKKVKAKNSDIEIKQKFQLMVSNLCLNISHGHPSSASMLGLPDLNFLTMSEMADAVRRMTARVCIPVIADGDTGYGDLHNVQRTVEAFEAAGASGILLEDQVMPKRCGHFANKRVISSEEMVLKIKAAVKAKSDPDFVIFARTDARQMNGLDDAIDRVNRCCDNGADIAEAPESRAELE